VFDWFNDRPTFAPPEWLRQILWTEIGLLRNPRAEDGRSILQDLSEATDDDTRLEALIHRQLTERLRQHFSGKDVSIYLEVTFFRPPLPLLIVKLAVQDGDTIHPQARARANLDFGPEDLT